MTSSLEMFGRTNRSRSLGFSSAGGDGPLRVGVIHLEAAHALQESALKSFILGTISSVGVLPLVQVKYSLNAGLKHFLHATEAGLHGRVECSPFDRDAEAGGA